MAVIEFWEWWTSLPFFIRWGVLVGLLAVVCLGNRVSGGR